MVAMATSLSHRLSSISAFCRPTTQSLKSPFITNHLVAIVHTKPVIANCIPLIGYHGNVPQHLWTPI